MHYTFFAHMHRLTYLKWKKKSSQFKKIINVPFICNEWWYEIIGCTVGQKKKEYP